MAFEVEMIIGRFSTSAIWMRPQQETAVRYQWNLGIATGQPFFFLREFGMRPGSLPRLLGDRMNVLSVAAHDA